MNKKVGKYTYGDERIIVSEPGADVIIGKFCSIGKDVRVILGQNHRTDWITTFPFGHAFKNEFPNFDGTGHPTTKGNIIIGNDVWIGTDVVIMSGVNIGDGVVIGAHSVVAKDIPPYSVVVGNPGKVIRKKFNDENIQFLLDLKWWDMDDSIINEISPILCSGDIQKLKNYFNKL
jgi:acetyltransferase-like isoleucine patch superfamily enzyme